MRISFGCRALLLSLAAYPGATTLRAQDAAHSPPPYLQIFQEQVKPGRAGLHPALESGWPRAFARAKIQNHYIGMSTLYGASEAWFCAGIRSIAEIEEQNAAIEKAPGLSKELDRLAQADAANISGNRVVLARYHPEFSNQPDINPAEMRFWEVLTFTVRPGHEGDFAQAAQLYRSVVEGAKATVPWATYEVMAGMPGPVFLIFVPHKTLAEIDPATGPMAAIEKSMTQETMKKFGSLSEGFASVETRILAVNPEMSYPLPEWVKQDPDFWGKKTKATASNSSSAPAAGSQ
jgi:hypothetical protein